ncbi:MAG: hypothetical protein ABSE82_16870, partial [Nitrososphaerales archaeon]
PNIKDIDISCASEIGILNTHEYRLGNSESQQTQPEDLVNAHNIRVPSVLVTHEKDDRGISVIGVPSTNLEHAHTDDQRAPSERDAGSSGWESLTEEVPSSVERISPITILSEHNGSTEDRVLGTLESSTRITSDEKKKYTLPVASNEEYVPPIIGIPNIVVSSTHITSDEKEEDKLHVPTGDEYLSSVISIPVIGVSSTPITPEKQKDNESIPPERKDDVPSTLSVPNISIPSTPDTNNTGISSAGGKGTGGTGDIPDLRRVSDPLNVPDTAAPDREAIRPSPSTARVLYLKIHAAVRGQDGLNKGEEKIYTFLWRTTYRSKEMGKAEFKIEGSRIEISLRDLARKVGLGLANCAWHMHCLEEKGCIVKVKETDHYHPAVYYVREFGQILQWRKEHGLTHFIQRGHLAAFIDPQSGTPITRFRGQSSTIYRGKVISSAPNIIELSLLNTNRGVLDSTGESVIDSSTPSVIDSSTQLSNSVGKEHKGEEAQTSSTSVGEPAPEQLSQSLNELLPFIDDQAVRFLWTECRSRVADCSVTEVIYFTKAKAAVLASGKIQNPIGFLLTAVPKCFEGQSFLAFRRALREQTDAEAKLRRQREEAQRQAEEDTQREIEAYTRAEETLNSMSQNDRDLLRQNVTREYLKRYPSARHMLDFESWIRRMMIREIVKKPGGFSR